MFSFLLKNRNTPAPGDGGNISPFPEALLHLQYPFTAADA
jgi:hypothetical protein